ncbi:Tuberous sclerosis 2-like protein [Neocucurbitaria cava]|uniref:Tuberous sclerosis 2-like protein n=1 Tax=Neocucurbitaria cava TaxID=798079 RepID=A0A9W9CLY9_9PLEO|nr:Tuberous sclerosis 2-like protein [Neocucurbitaria cava]
MSPPTENVPRTPDRRSSTQALFTAFRSLTTGRLKSPTPPPPSTSSATADPARTPSLASTCPGSVASPQSADGTLPRTGQISTGPRAAKPVTGGPPELHGLIARLDRSHSFSERAPAVDKICQVLAEYPVQNILGLWSVASDLLLPEQIDEVADAGYKLLKSCASLSDLSTIERNVFFDAASLRKSDSSFHKRLDIVAELTRGGRDIEACESSIVPFLLTSLDTCFQASRDASNVNRKTHSKRSIDKPLQETENLALMFQYVTDICKFNAKIFTDDDLDLLLRRAVFICQNTTQESDIKNCIKLFDTIITFVHVPKQSLRPCLEVLCAIHKQMFSLQQQTWNTLSNLFKSHVGQAAISCLLHALLDTPEQESLHESSRKSKQHNLYRGTIQVLQLLLFEDGRNELPKVPMSLLFPALKASIKEPHHTQEEIVISLIDTVLAQDSMRDLLLAETDLSDLLDIIRICAERDDNRLRAKGTKTADSSNAVKTETGEKSQSAFETNSSNRRKYAIATSAVSNLRSSGGQDSSTSPISPTSEFDDKGGPHSDVHDLLPLRPQAFHRDRDDGICQVLAKLDGTSDALDFVSREAVMELFLQLAHRVSDSSGEKMIRYFARERYLIPSNGDWLKLCRHLVAGILQDVSRPRTLRILALHTLRETYETVEQLCPTTTTQQCGALLLDNIESEDDIEVLSELVDFAVSVADRAPVANFLDILQVLKRRLDRQRASSTAPSSFWSPQLMLPNEDKHLGTPSNVICTAFVRLFTRSVTHAAQKTRILYENLRAVAENDKYEPDARLTALKLLFRLRADSRHALIVSHSSEGERIAAELCRTEETAVTPEKGNENNPSDQTKAEDNSSWREQRKTSGSSPHSSLNRHTGRTTTSGGRVSKPIPPLWMYPGSKKGLPEEPPSDPSRVVFSHIDASPYPLSDDVLDMEITLWLELLISLLQRPPDWEIYSYVLVHLGPQLSNQALVRSCVVQLRMLRNVLCEQVRNSSFHEPPPHTLVKKADVAVCLFHILTVIISYHEYFEKSEEDDLVKAFLQGITQWDRTSRWCIHALSVCCFEIPLSVSKSLDSIVQKMSQIITKPATAIHILEFLTSIARLPELYKNFREDEFKLVFGVCFRYLQHIRDLRDRASNNISSQSGPRTLWHSGPSRDFTASPPNTAKPKSVEDDLPGYLYSLAYHVITFWFMALKMEDRAKQIPWITRNLYYTDSTGRQVMEEQGQVIMDIMNMVAYTDRDQTVRNEDFAKLGDGEIWKKTWIVGNRFVTIETAARTGVSLITTRRPCGTRYLTIQPLLTSPPRHQVPITVGLASEAYYSDSYVGILPDDIFQTFYSTFDLVNPSIPLPDDDMTRRAIASFDRIATVDSYKVGVIYIGEGQTDEREIFMNDIGSPAFTAFVADLGTLCRLKDAKFNTGGLDTREDMDGEFTYCWRDRCIELVFHIPTMMPTNRDDEMTYPNKKRHIGNDFVNIIYNDSGLPYNFDTFPSAFNYVHIVISPESRASFVDRRLDADPDGRNRYYKVQAISRPGFPDISPAVETKILQGKYLAAYCRLIAINACVFSNVWFIRGGGESTSSWRNRLREIKRLRDRYGGGVGGDQVHTVASPVVASPASSQILSSPPSRDQNGVSPFQRISIATHITDGTSRSSISSSSHDP